MEVYPVEIPEGTDQSIVVNILDADGDPVTPSAADWSFYDADGNVINSRSNIALSPLASEMTVPMLAADFVIADNENETEIRVLTVAATVAGEDSLKSLTIIMRNLFNDVDCA